MVRAIHWFNPLVWLAERTARMDQEMACDEWVLARSTEEGRADYGEAILRAARSSGNAGIIRAEMAESNRGLARRIRHLAAAHPRGAWTLAVMLALGIGAVLLFAPKLSERAAPPLKSLIEIQTRFLEVSPEAEAEFFSGGKSVLLPDEFEQLVRRMDKRGDLDLMSAPTVTTPPGQKALIQIVREFRYPTKFEVSGNQGAVTPLEFETKDIGIKLEVLASLTGDNRVLCTLKPEVTEFLGFVNYGARLPEGADGGDAIDAAIQPVKDAAEIINQPVFRIREMESTVLLRSGQTAVLGGLSRRDPRGLEQTVGVNGVPKAAPSEGEMRDRVLYVFVTVQLIGAEKGSDPVRPAFQTSPSAPPVASPSPPASPEGNLPYGSPVPNKPGFITSPYAPERGYVDVRGFPPGTEVRCPYTSRAFRVP